MSTVKINNKNYVVPELTFKHLPVMEKCGMTANMLMSGKYPFTAAEVFTAIVVGCDYDQADYLMEQHILGGGNVEDIFSAFADAMVESGFFAKLLGLDKKEAPAKKTAPKKKSAEE